MIIYAIYKSGTIVSYCATLDIAKEYVRANIPTKQVSIKETYWKNGCERTWRWAPYDNLDTINAENCNRCLIMEEKDNPYHFQVYGIQSIKVIDK